MMRHYRPSPSTLETILFSSVAHLAASQALFESATASMQVRRLSAQSHLDVVRQPTAVAEWTAGICECINLSENAKNSPQRVSHCIETKGNF
jgi:hypothetical protein